MELALEIGVDDFATEEDRCELLTAPEGFAAVQEALEARGVPLAAKRAGHDPPDHGRGPVRAVNQVLRLTETLEDHDDVQKVWANFNIDENVLAARE